MRTIVLRQSPGRALIHRASNLAPVTLAWAAVVVFGTRWPVLPVPPVSPEWELVAILAPPALAWLWLVVFNRGADSVPALEIRLDDTGIHHIRYGEVASIPWAAYRDVQIRGWPTRRIRIRSRGGDDITFDLHAIDPDQRETLLLELARRPAELR